MRRSLVVILLLSGCVQAQRSRAPVAVSLDSDTPGCFVAASDPTRDAARTWDQAADHAFVQVAEVLLGVDIQSGIHNRDTTEGQEDYAVSILRTRGSLSGIGIAGWWVDRDGSGPTGECHGPPCSKAGTVWAVACVRGSESQAPKVLPGAFRGPLPDWLKRPDFGTRARACALGVSGPTRFEADTVSNALEEAQRRLAQLLCVQVDSTLVDWIDRRTWFFPEIHATDHAIEHVRKAAVKDAVWLDEAGKGPLGGPGTAYARVCVDATEVACDQSRDRSRDGRNGSMRRGKFAQAPVGRSDVSALCAAGPDAEVRQLPVGAASPWAVEASRGEWDRPGEVGTKGAIGSGRPVIEWVEDTQGGTR